MGKNTKLALTVNIIIFSLIFLLHLYRIITNTTAKFGIWVVPIWISYLGLVVAAILVYINYKGL